jgi:hypothetical protein
MGENQRRNDAAQECFELASRCLVEASRTLDREAAGTLRNLAKRYFKEADAQEHRAAERRCAR